jgi:hypothetical protein
MPETIPTVTTKIVRRLLQIQQDMEYAGNCVNHLTDVLTDLGTPNLRSNDLGVMDVRQFFTPVGGATYTVDGVTTPKYTGLTFSIQGELEKYNTAYRGYLGLIRNTILNINTVRYYYSTVPASGHWEVLYKGTTTQYSTTGASDPVVQFKQGGLFLTIKLPGDGIGAGFDGMGAAAPYVSTTADGTKQETRFILQGTLLACQIIAEATQKAIRAVGEVDTVNTGQSLYADANPGADVLRSKWTLGYIRGPLGPDGTIFDRS